MKIAVNARHMEVTDSIRQFVEGKVSKLPKFLDNIQSIEVILDKEALKAVTEIVVTAKKKHVFVATHHDDDLYASIDQCIHKIVQQLHRHKDRIRDRQTTGLNENFEA